MSTTVVTVSHSNDGIRISWPDSTTDVFANEVYLAESYARCRQLKEDARVQLVETVAGKLNKFDRLLEDEAAPLAELSELREAILEAAKMLT